MAEHSHRTIERHTDVAVVGGSAAGLAAALQLGRQRRSVIVVDDGTPRNAPSAHVHGFVGHEGVRPSELVEAAREEVRSYGVEVLPGRVERIERIDDGHLRLALTGGHSIVARRVLAATGLVDELPDIAGVAEHWGNDVVHCPFCHGFEIRDRRIVVVVTHPMGLHPVALYRQLTEHLTVVVHDDVAADATAARPRAGPRCRRHPRRGRPRGQDRHRRSRSRRVGDARGRALDRCRRRRDRAALPGPHRTVRSARPERPTAPLGDGRPRRGRCDGSHRRHRCVRGRQRHRPGPAGTARRGRREPGRRHARARARRGRPVRGHVALGQRGRLGCALRRRAHVERQPERHHGRRGRRPRCRPGARRRRGRGW